MEAKKNPQTDTGRNSTIYFAIGLNIMLFLSWQALEYRTYEKSEVEIDILNVEAEEAEEEIPILNINTPPPPPPPPAVIQQNIQIVEDVVDIEETVIESTETNQDDAIEERVVSVSDVYVEDYEEDVEVAFAVIESVPVFPGCEGKSRAETKECFQNKIQKHVMDNFEYPKTALEMGIQGRVSVVFVIDTKGHTINVRSRGPDRLLEEEAERIINLLPQMKPGMQRGRPVKVSYAVPIYFKFRPS